MIEGPFQQRTWPLVLAARFARALLRHFTLLSKRAQGRPGAGWHPRSAARKAHAGKPHSSIQVVPITRPSRRDGWTAYAVLPGAEFLLASLVPTKVTSTAPVDADAAFARA